MKYPNISVESLHDGWTLATVVSLSTNEPKAYASDVFPVPEIPSRIINLFEANDAINKRIKFVIEEVNKLFKNYPNIILYIG